MNATGLVWNFNTDNEKNMFKSFNHHIIEGSFVSVRNGVLEAAALALRILEAS